MANTTGILTQYNGASTLIGGVPSISYTCNFDIAEAAPVSIGVIASTGTTAASATNNPFGSSLSLQRMFVPAQMNLTEVDLAFGINFSATSAGQGSMSQSFVIYTIGNSTSLGSLVSASRAVSWASGTTTSGTSSSLQQGWQGNNIQPFTFAATSIPAGEYVFAHLLSWAASSTSWTVSVYGAIGNSSNQVAQVTGITSASLGALSSGGLAAVTAFTGTTNITLSSMSIVAGSGVTGTVAVSAFTGTTNIVMNSESLHAASGITGALGVASYGSAFLAGSWGGINGNLGFSAISLSWPNVSTSASTIVMSAGVVSYASSAGATHSFGATAVFLSGNSNIVSAVTLGVSAGSIITGTTAATALSAAGYQAGSLITGAVAGSIITGTTAQTALSAAGYTAGSFIGTSGVVNALTNIGLAALGSTTLAVTTIPSFGYNGSLAMTTNTTQASYMSGAFMNGIMATGSSLASIDLKSTAVTATGSIALVQPWFALVGS